MEKTPVDVDWLVAQIGGLFLEVAKMRAAAAVQRSEFDRKMAEKDAALAKAQRPEG